ncbi:MAG: hypothetical protein M3Y27_17780 [Acidobacteriota bacterium]|nr:hypothetical protein [Acidobacteriota bacterium]
MILAETATPGAARKIRAGQSRIGVAWLHRDGNGFDVVLDAIPVNGRVVLRLNVPKPAKK